MSGSDALAKHWPLFGLVVHTPRLELRYPDDATLAELLSVSTRGIHPPDDSPFTSPWSLEPSPQRERDSLRFWWRQRADVSPDRFELPMAVVVDDQVVGVQAVGGRHFVTSRVVSTGSWLGREFQGRGTGTEMRRAILELAFVGLGALEAYSGAFESNLSSIGVSHAVGYADNGEGLEVRAGAGPERMIRFRITRAAYLERRRDDITIDGLEPCLGLLGLA